MRWAHTTANIGICNDYYLPIVDEAEKTMSTYICKDVKPYQPTISWITKDGDLMS